MIIRFAFHRRTRRALFRKYGTGISVEILCVSKTWKAIGEKILYSENIFWLFRLASTNPFFSQCLRCRIFSLVRHLGIDFAYLNHPWNLKLQHCKSLETLQIFHVRAKLAPPQNLLLASARH